MTAFTRRKFIQRRNPDLTINELEMVERATAKMDTIDIGSARYRVEGGIVIATMGYEHTGMSTHFCHLRNGIDVEMV